MTSVASGRAESAAPAWVTLDAAAVLARARTSADGLSAEEAARRLAEHGPNALPEPRRRTLLGMLAGQLGDTMVLVLIGAAIISALIGEAGDTIAIVVIVVLDAVLGVAQEYRAERAVAALRALAAPHARVRRDGAVHAIPAAELVPGDVVLLEAGNVVPADLRLVESAGLRAEESMLTGESVPVDKDAAPLADASAPLAERRDVAHQGTTIVYGRGVGVVIATGAGTELGRIAALLHEQPETQTPLQRRLAAFGRRIAVAILALCVVIFVAGMIRGEQPVLMFMTALSLAVAAIPEALPAVVAVSLALGARKMVRQRALVRRLPAVETLGSVTYVCTDKTGTLTLNHMRVDAIDVGGERRAPDTLANAEGAWGTMLDALALSTDAVIDGAGLARGDPTEVAMHDAAHAAGRDPGSLLLARPRVGEVPFSSERARMTTLHRDDGAIVAYMKGAPERVIPLCVDRLVERGTVPLDAARVLDDAERMAAEGLRVIAVATRTLGALPADAADAERDATFVGLVGMIDPPRPSAAPAVAVCQEAGMRVVMITGDHPATALAIARRLGIAHERAELVTGVELAAMSDEELAARVEQVRVYARVAPEDKIRIVAALQEHGELVAMTGDGVNDAPALRRADIGVAMGGVGTDVAREAAHMILLDDDFATIVSAIREGRRIYDDVRKFVRYVLTGNSGEIWLLLLAPFLGFPLPLLPIHLLWVNLVTDGLPGLALVAEPAEREVMRRPPRPPRESLFAHGLWQHVVWVGLLIGGVSLGVLAWSEHEGLAHWRTMVFTTITFSQMAHVLAIRSERNSLLAIGLASNRPLLGAVALTFLLQLATLYFAPLSRAMETQPLTLRELAITIGASFIVLIGVEFEKWMVRRGWIYREEPAR